MFLTIKEVAKLLRISERHAYNLVSNNDIPNVRIKGKILIPKEQLLNQLFEGKDWK